MVDSFKYRAFISYSHADESIAKWLHQTLERYRVPSRVAGKVGARGVVPRKIGPCFRDQADLSAASHLGETLRQALLDSESLVIVCSPRSATSRWVNEEIAFYRSLGRGDFIYALIVDGEPNANDPSQECFPQALLHDEHGTRSYEPIAADIRAGRDSKTDGFLKIVSGLIGVSFDELRQREQRRRTQLMLAAVSTSLVIAAITTGLAIDAEHSRDQARLAQADAERRQHQVEDLLQFLLGDLHEKLEPIGKLDILDAVGQRVIGYFTSIDPKDVDDATMGSYATALRQIGDVRARQGNLRGAQQAYDEALKFDETLLGRHPGQTSFIRNVAATEYATGYAHYMKGDLDPARTWFERYLASTQRLAALEPADPEWTHLVIDAKSNLGAVAYARNDIESALAAFTQALAQQDALVAKYPDKRDDLYSLAVIHGWLHTLNGANEKWSEARSQASRAADLHRRLLGLAADNAQYKFNLAGADVDMLSDDLHLAALKLDAPELIEASRITRELHDLDSDNVDYAHLRIIVLKHLAEAQLAANRLADALATALDEFTLARLTYERAPANAEARETFFVATAHLVGMEILRRDRNAAAKRVRELTTRTFSADQLSSAGQAWLDLCLLDWWLSTGTADAASARARAHEAMKAARSSSPNVRADLLFRYVSLSGEGSKAHESYSRLPALVRDHPFMRAFCSAVSGACS